MNIADQLNLLESAFKDWSKQYAATVGKAMNIDDLITRVRETPGAARVVIMFHREEKRGEYEESGLVDRYFWVAVSSPIGLKANPGDRLTEGQAGGAPIFTVAESARDKVIRKASFLAAETEVTPDYKGMEPLTVNGNTLTDILRLEFSIGCQLDAPS